MCGMQNAELKNRDAELWTGVRVVLNANTYLLIISYS